MLIAISVVVGLTILGLLADHGLCEIAKAIVAHAEVVRRAARRHERATEFDQLEREGREAQG